jgi:hypothetical protein
MEDRVTPSWGSVPPAVVANVAGTPLTTLNGFGQAAGNADIAADEVDWIKISAPATGAYQIRTDNTASGINTVLGVYNFYGNRIAYNDDASPTDTSSALTINLIKGYTYYIGVTNLTGTPGGAYSWSIDGPSFDDIYEPNNTRLAARGLGILANSKTINNLIAFNDDWFRFATVNRGSPLNSVTIAYDHTYGDLVLSLYDVNGNLITSSANAGADSQTVSLNGLATGIYSVAITEVGGAQVPSYSLTIAPPPRDDAFENNDSLATAHWLGSLTSTKTVSNLVMWDSADWYKFSTPVPNETNSAVSINFVNANGNLDLKVFNSAGVEIGESLTSNDGESVSLAGTSAGTYYVEVFSASGDVNPNYSLTIAPTPPTWYTLNIHDPTLLNMVRTFNTGTIDRGDFLQMFTQVEQDGTVSATELNDLRAVVGNTSVIHLDAPVRVLARKVVTIDMANAHYQGAILGSLVAGNPATKLETLVDKWFFGTDHPKAETGTAYVQAAGTLFGPAISYADVMQGDLGDCYLLSALGAVARQNSQAIRNMFIDNGDGTFTVRFFKNGVADYVTVDGMLPSSGGQFVYANSGDSISDPSNVLWVALAEKAYAQENEDGGLGQPVAVNSYAGIDGGFPDFATKQIAGVATFWDWTDNATFSSITAAFNRGAYIEIGTPDFTLPNVVSDHSYVMISYNAASQTVTLYNPWGPAGGFDGGQFKPGTITLTMAQLWMASDAWYHS